MTKQQTEIPGTERAVIAEVEEACEDYRLLRDQRMALSEKEAEAKARLIDRMKAHSVKAYRYADQDGVERKASIAEKENVKVSKVKTSDGGGEDVSVS
jgi:hypothetical protein